MVTSESTQQERFKYMREEIINLSQQKLADKLGIKQQTIADIESGRKQKIDTEILYKLMEEYLINTEWLLFNTGNPTKTDDYEENLHEQSKISVYIPFYSSKVAAGEGSSLQDYPVKEAILFDKRWLENVLNVQPENLSLVTAEGDSMLPSIQDGDLLMVDNSNLNIINNKVYVIRQDSKLRVKRLKKEITGEIRIISDNDKYPIETVDTETEIIGQVVWNGSKSII